MRTITFCILFFLSSPVEALQLYQSSIRGLSAESGFSFELWFDLQQESFLINNEQIFDNDDSGRVLTFESGDRGFDLFSNLLTDGVDQRIQWNTFGRNFAGEIESSIYGTSLESRRVNQGIIDGVSLNNVDFQGYVIDRVQISILSIAQSTAQQDGNLWLTASWEIFGEPTSSVPEPTTAALLGTGLFGVRRMKRRRFI